MRFAVVLATLVGLAVATPKSPLFKRQCPTQPQDCCLKTGTCDTCYFGTEPYPCNCECLQVGGCPCTEIDNDLNPPQCIGWSAGESGHVSSMMCLYFCYLSRLIIIAVLNSSNMRLIAEALGKLLVSRF